jgi:hypothetical protein
MKMKLVAISMIVLAACRQQPAETGTFAINEPAAPTNIEVPANDVAANAGGSNEVASRARLDDRKVLEEPMGPIDPKSPEAAGQIVQHYGAMIEQGRFTEAASYWGDKGLAAGFAKELQSRGLKHLEIGDLSAPEGAAGSIYVTMPVAFYQGTKRSPATVTLRRVNDVDGSTAAQRRWHIERIEWGKA